MLKKLTLIFLFMTSSLQASLFWPTEKGDRILFAEAYKLSLEISEFCPKEDCLIIGIGRSPTIFMDIFEKENLANFIRFPLSNFRYNPHNEDKTPAQDESLSMQLSEDEKERLFKYMDERIGPSNLKGIKRVAFLDFSMTGKSIYGVSEYFKQHLNNKNLELKVQNIILGRFERYINIMDWAIPFKVDKKSIKYFALDDSRPLYGALSSQMFDAYSKYDKVEIKRGAILRETYSPKRQVYLDALGVFIEQVKSLGSKNCMETLRVFMTH